VGHVGAQADEAMFELGSQAMAFPGHSPGNVRAVRVNGVVLSLRTQVVESPLAETLRHYERLCSRTGATLSPYAQIFSHFATRKGVRDSDGYVACIDLAVTGLETIVRKFSRFSETWDLSELGPIRYVYARRAEARPSRDTFVLTLWTEGSLDLSHLLPIAGDDAPGSDLPGVPRPSGAQRILSAKEDGEDAGVFIYLSGSASPGDIERTYRRRLPQLGWTIVERSPGESVQVSGIRMLSAEKGPRLVTLLASTEASGRTMTTILATGRQ